MATVVEDVGRLELSETQLKERKAKEHLFPDQLYKLAGEPVRFYITLIFTYSKGLEVCTVTELRAELKNCNVKPLPTKKADMISALIKVYSQEEPKTQGKVCNLTYNHGRLTSDCIGDRIGDSIALL